MHENDSYEMSLVLCTGNGNGAVDSDDEDASKLRPVNIEQDVREMERRKRVEAIMASKLFR